MEDCGVVREKGDHNNRAKRLLTQRLLAHFTDGAFHPVCAIAAWLGTDLTFTRTLCNRIVQRGTYQVLGERRPAPPSQGRFAYRFVKGGKRISLEAFYVEVQPVLKEMDAIIYGPRVDFSQQAMQLAFAQFCKVIHRVAR